ncbi:MAG: cellulase family glycosylhydrolase [Anaerolineales bacterium]|nr:cellulase family glycosylhydrolase [Anaerolineales bacterium]
MKISIPIMIIISLVISSCQNLATITPTNIPAAQSQNDKLVGFLKTDGRALVYAESGEPFRIKAINFTHDPSAEEYVDAHSMGFNTVRLTLELDPKGVEFDYPWLDTQISYARDAGVYLIPTVKVNQSRFWSNKSNAELEEFVVDFWSEFAEKYANESIIAAYDLFNTPSPLELNQWQELAEEITSAIRKVDSKHPLVVQAALAPDRTFIYLDDTNYVLGFDFFKPLELSGNSAQYPNNKLFKPGWDKFRLTGFISNPKLAAGTTDWTETSTSLNLIADREAVIGIPGIACNNLLGSAWFSNFVIREIDETGQSSREIQEIDLSQSSFWAPWTGDNSAMIEKVDGGPEGESGQSILFAPNQEGKPASGTNADLNFAFEAVPGRSYTVSGWMRGEDVNADADCKFNIEFYSYTGKDSLIVWDRDHLRREFERLTDYGKYHNLPMMVVDFGVTRNALGNGGEVWGQDMFELLDESYLSYAWKSYRDAVWGLYDVNTSESPNSTLVQLFQRNSPELALPPTQETQPNVIAPIQDGFVHARGQDLVVGESEAAFHLKGINFNNNLYTDKFPYAPYHGKRDSFAVRNMGFNVIRFNLTYQWFTENPEVGWPWLDQQIAWAKDAGVYLIINMHYVPGQGIGTISYDPVNQQQTADLWRTLADRYKDEHIIAGYDLLNEPADVESAVYQAYMQKVVNAIREVDSNHLIIVEAINEYTPRFVTVNDNNVMYDFHFYHPIDLTHENVSGSLDTKTYPDEDFLEIQWENSLKYLVSSRTISIPAGSSDWIEYQSPLVDPGKQDGNEIFGDPLIYCNSNEGTAYFGDFQLLAVEGSSAPRVLRNMSITANLPVYKAVDSGSVVFGLSPQNYKGGEDGRSLTIRKTTDRAWIGFPQHRIEVQPNTQYAIRGWMKGEGISSGTDCYFVIEFFQLDPIDKLLRHDRDFLAERLAAGIDFREQNDVPINVGEFGVYHTAFLNPDAGGARWVADMLDLLMENNINFAYWDYDGSWGLYPDLVHYPDAADINIPLLNVFLDKLAP